MALTQISTGGIKDDAVTDAKLPANSVGNSEMKDDAVGVAELSATGTPSSSTFLRGDNSWVTPTDTNTQRAFANDANNRVVTGDGSGGLNGEANLTFDGSLLKLQTDSGEFRIEAANGVDAFSVDSDNGNTYIGGKTNIGDTQMSSNLLNIEDNTAATIDLASHGAGGDTAYIGVKKSTGGGLTLGISNRDIIFKTGATYSNGTTFDSGNERLRILSANDTTFSSPGTLVLTGDSAYNSANNAGAGIRFIGKYDSSSNTTALAHIAGIKENTTSGEYGGAITFHVRQNGGLGEEAARFTSAGNLKFPNGHGIDFSANSHATGMSSETLDSYEEGTFTPSVTGGLSGGTISYNSQSGRYTKIGDKVSFTFFMNIASCSLDSGGLTFGGLPFTSANDSNKAGAAWRIFYNGNIDSADSYKVLGNSTTIQVITAAGDARAANTTSIDAGNRQLSYWGFYFV